MEAAYDKGATDPELQALMAEGISIVRSTQFALYRPLP
jgi:hypothetical protein